MRTLGILLVVVSGLAAQHTGQDSPNEKKPNPAIGNREAIAAGRKLYLRSCAGCHGPDGGGARGPNLIRRSNWHPLDNDGIFRVIRNGVPGADMPPTKLGDEETWSLVAFVHSMTAPAVTVGAPGDAAAGEAVFRSEKAGCTACHSIRGQGGKAGPDLTNVGGRLPLALLREAILDPSKDPPAGNEAVTLALRDGRRLEGVAKNRSNYALQLVDRAGKLHLIDMANVAELAVSDRSPMPGDYKQRLSRKEFEDLIAFLARQAVRESK
ncbi:MAG: c-type cytochrome [Bryobacteraceae bacterium]|nr:c-type cytochrome [Bryobacteraceae bacterium]